ncbi:alpha/beta fold hydrolase [Arthrobacter sp. GAS37]|uniref:alpha/beta fold hydrolase n=1 Tax=Arthrobacter sp. GAS37 TaxID=3156261 RepID=UPI00384CAF06
MGAGPVVVVGHSMGTQFATELAVRRPELVSHVVLIGPVVDSERRTVFRQSLALGLDSLLESSSGNAIVFTDYAHVVQHGAPVRMAAGLALAGVRGSH